MPTIVRDSEPGASVHAYIGLLVTTGTTVGEPLSDPGYTRIISDTLRWTFEGPSIGFTVDREFAFRLMNGAAVVAVAIFDSVGSSRERWVIALDDAPVHVPACHEFVIPRGGLVIHMTHNTKGLALPHAAYEPGAADA